MIGFQAKPKGRAKLKNKVGLDIGTHTVKIIEITDAPEKPLLTGLGMKNVAGMTKKEVSEAIKELAGESKITAKEANISVSGPSVTARFISMPKMEDKSLRGAIRFEAEKFIPFNINECVIDFQILKKDDKENKITILLVAAKKERVQDTIKIAEDAGFSARIVDTDSFAAANAFFRNFAGPAPDKSFAILNIGAAFTNVCITRDNIPCFVRDMTIGGNDFNAAIAKAAGIEARAAESLKISPNERRQEVIDCTRSVATGLADETRLSFSYYENQYGRSVDEVYLSGGSARLPGLEELFRETFGPKLSFWNPLQFLDAGPSGIDPALLDKAKDFFGVAAGLVLR